MVDKTVATLTAATALDGTELYYGVQGGADTKVTGAQLKTLAVGTPAAGKVLAGATPDFTATPTLGASGTLGSITFGNETSGTVNLQPVTGALGAVTVRLPAATDTLVGKATTDTLTNKTLTSPVLTTPTLGVATATSINKMAITAPATSSTLAVADGKTLTASNSLTLAGTDTTTMTFPTTSATVARTDAANTFTGTQTLSGALNLAAGTTVLSPVTFASGTNLTSAVAGTCEFDGVQFYQTVDTTSGRGALPIEQYFHLAANGSAITTIANIFGTTSNISLVASAYYIIDIYLWMVTTGTGATTYTLTNSAAPTSQNILYEMSPITGIVAPPGTATMLVGQILNDATAARTIVTGSLSAATHYVHMKVWLKNGTGTSLKIQATAASTNTTPQIGSFWHARRISPNNIGTFAA